MRPITIEDISALQRNPKNIRNICILAHVDHGKTTMADCLIASNGIISQRLAGKLRYMDSRPDEQKRGITMKSSAISLHYEKDAEHFLINLIDSPGHIDFSSEVSTAVRLCDGAVVLVDAVEGVCPQTHAVLRQAWLENIRPCLVLNKMDRLITELRLSPLEAYVHLQQILEQVNAITGSLFTSQVMEMNADESCQSERENKVSDDSKTQEQVYDWDAGLVEADDSNIYFSPEQGNVKFASAFDGWAFGIDEFAAIFSKKLGVKTEILHKTLWGDFYLNAKTKRIMKGAQSKGKKPLFVQFILESIWKVYEAVLETRDKDKIEKMVANLGLTISVRDSRYSDARVHLNAIFRQWLPLSEAILGMVSSKLPNPLEVSEDRIEKLMCGGLRKFDSLPTETKELKQAFKDCSSADTAPIIVYVSKMFSVPQEYLPKHRKRPLTHEEIEKRREIVRQKHLERKEAKAQEINPAEPDKNKDVGTIDSEQNMKVNDDNVEKEEDNETFVAFARIFSGSIEKGQKVYVLGPKYDPAKGLKFDKESTCNSEVDFDTLNKESSDAEFNTFDDVDVSRHMATCEVGDLYLMMGREFEIIEKMCAGNIVAINGLKNYILKSATLTSSLACPAFTPMPFEARPIVRVALEPKQPSELPLLVKGLKLLNQADPCVRVLVQETGEYVIVTAGEVHLQRCLDDLRSRYACIEIAASSPITPFRETIVEQPKIDMANEDITDADSSQHIQRLPAFMLREIQDWNDTIKKSNQNYDSSTESTSRDGTKRIKQSENKKSRNDKNTPDLGIIEAKTANKTTCVSIRCIPLPVDVTKLLESNYELMRAITQVSSGLTSKERKDLRSTLTESTRNNIKQFHDDLKQIFEESGQEWNNACDLIWSFGPRGMGPNILLNKIQRYKRPSIWNSLIENVDNAEETENSACAIWDNDNSIINGFQLATLAGPMCEEPMMGVCFVVEDWKTALKSDAQSSTDGENCHGESGESDLNQENNTDGKSEGIGSRIEDQEESPEIIESNQKGKDEFANSVCDRSKSSTAPSNDTYGPLSGQLISAVKEGCRRAFMSQPMRLMAAMYSCEIQATTEVLGRMYAVISKREGRILSEDMKEGTDIFNVKSVLPVAESFGFSEEIRKKTSGLASPQLVFSHWEVIDVDPFWIPTTEEEYLLYGEKADSENQALKYVISVRRRKGLYVEEKVVEFAEKQRTLKKNK